MEGIPIKQNILSAVLCIFIVLLFYNAASANLASVYGISNKASAMGNAYTANPDDASATYYNPAGLALRNKNEISFGISYFYPALWIKGIDNVKNYSESKRLVGFTLGIDTNLGHLTDYNRLSGFSIGILLYTPPDRAYSVHAIPSDIKSFPLYQDTASQLMLLLGIGYKISKYLDIGASALLYMPGVMQTDYYINIHQQPIHAVALVDRSLITSIKPEFGIIVKPLNWINIGIAYREKNASGLKGETSFFMQGQEITSQTNYEKIVSTPTQLAAGISIKPFDSLRINADLTYGLWSENGVTNTEGNALNAHDTVTTAFGVQYKVTNRWALRGGYMYSPSPFPPQTKQTNYVDGDKNIYSVGFGYKFNWFVQTIKAELNMFAQVQRLNDRNNNKAKPYLSYSSGGSAWSTGISLSFKL